MKRRFDFATVRAPSDNAANAMWAVKTASSTANSLKDIAKSPQFKSATAAFGASGIGAPVAVTLGVITIVAECVSALEAYHEMKKYLKEMSIVIQGFFQVFVLAQTFNDVCKVFLRKKTQLRALYLKSMEDPKKDDWETFEKSMKTLVPREETPSTSAAAIVGSAAGQKEAVAVVKVPDEVPPESADNETLLYAFQFLGMDPTLMDQIRYCLDDVLLCLFPYLKDTILPQMESIYTMNSLPIPDLMKAKVANAVQLTRTRYAQNIGKFFNASSFTTTAIPKINELLTQANARFILLLSHQKTMTEFLEQHLPQNEFEELTQLYYLQPNFLTFVYFGNSRMDDKLMDKLQLSTFKSFMHHRFVDAVFEMQYPDQLSALANLDGAAHNVNDVRELFLKSVRRPFRPGKALEEINKMEKTEVRRKMVEDRAQKHDQDDKESLATLYKREDPTEQARFLNAYYPERPADITLEQVIEYEQINKLPDELDRLKKLLEPSCPAQVQQLYSMKHKMPCPEQGCREVFQQKINFITFNREYSAVEKQFYKAAAGSPEYDALKAKRAQMLAEINKMRSTQAPPVANPEIVANTAIAPPVANPTVANPTVANPTVAKAAPKPSAWSAFGKLFTQRAGKRRPNRSRRRIKRSSRKRIIF
jgi:hypothetical protein